MSAPLGRAGVWMLLTSQSYVWHVLVTETIRSAAPWLVPQLIQVSIGENCCSDDVHCYKQLTPPPPKERKKDISNFCFSKYTLFFFWYQHQLLLTRFPGFLFIILWHSITVSRIISITKVMCVHPAVWGENSALILSAKSSSSSVHSEIQILHQWLIVRWFAGQIHG